MGELLFAQNSMAENWEMVRSGARKAGTVGEDSDSCGYMKHLRCRIWYIIVLVLEF